MKFSMGKEGSEKCGGGGEAIKKPIRWLSCKSMGFHSPDQKKKGRSCLMNGKRAERCQGEAGKMGKVHVQQNQTPSSRFKTSLHNIIREPHRKKKRILGWGGKKEKRERNAKTWGIV